MAQAGEASPVHDAESLVVARADIVHCPLGDGIALFDPGSGTYFSLNRTAALLWDDIRRGARPSDLVDALMAGTAGPADRYALTADVDALVQGLRSAGLVLDGPSALS